MPTIDDFIHTPLLITTGIGVLLIILLLIIKIRNTCSASFIFYFVIGAVIAGCITAAVTGYLSLMMLMKLIRKGKLQWFAAYLIPVGILGMILL